MASSPAIPYAVGDVILVEQGGLLHLAKVLKLSEGEEEHDVYIHYHKWSDKWDCWTKLAHTRPVNGETLAEQKRMKDEQREEQNAKNKKQKKREESGAGRADKGVPAADAAATAIAAAAQALKAEAEELSADIIPPLPNTVKRRLVLDWESLTRKQRILTLPARLPVITLLAAFLHDQHAKTQHAVDSEVAAKQEAVLQVCEGLLCYFERCLPAVLLYRIERPQLQQLAANHSLSSSLLGQPNASPLFSLQHYSHTLPPVASTHSSSSSSSSASTPPPTALTHWLGEPSADAQTAPAPSVAQWSGVYGVEHLVRLLCKLPAILRDGEAEWLPQQRDAVRYTLSTLYKWLSAHDELIYAYSRHEQPTPEYMFKLQQPQHGASLKDEAPEGMDEQHSPSKAKRKAKREQR